MADPRWSEVVMKIYSQGGKTEIEKAYIMYRMAGKPSNIVVAMPTLEDVQHFHSAKLLPGLKASPVTKRIFREKTVGRRGDEDMGMSNVHYPGGHLRYVNAHAGRSWRGKTAPALIADELDAFPGSLDANDPVQMLRQRGASMPADQVSLIVSSTPVAGGFIDSYYERGSQAHWFVRCCHCNHWFEWIWKEEFCALGWMPCPKCGCQFSDFEIREMNAGGHFVHSFPDADGRSYHINQFASTRIPHADTLKSYNPVSPRGFWTQCLALSYEDVSETLEAPGGADSIWLDERPAPPEAVTGGVDVQANRLVWSLCEWRQQMTQCFVFEHGETYYAGGPDASWAAKGEAWQEVFYKLAAAQRIFVDTQGVAPNAIRRMIAQHMPGKGQGVHGAKTSDDLDNPGGLILGWSNQGDLRLCTQQAKSALAEMMHRGDFHARRGGVPAGGWVDYYTQLTSEKLITQADGRKKMWQLPVKGRRNDALDAWVYALCAAVYPTTLMAKRRRK